MNAKLIDVKTQIAALAAQQGALIAERVTLLAEMATAQSSADDRMRQVQEIGAQIVDLKTHLFDDFVAAVAATPSANTYADVGAAMDVAAGK